MEELKKFLVGFLVRWILKIAGTYFVTIGIQQNTIEETVGGLVAIILGIIVSLIQQKKALDTPPPQVAKK